jgi:hypothetical protein
MRLEGSNIGGGPDDFGAVAGIERLNPFGRVAGDLAQFDARRFAIASL